MEKFISLLGIVIQILICYALSTNRKAINWRLVAMGMGLQLVFAYLIISTSPGKAFFALMNDIIVTILNFTTEGARFVFGNLADAGAAKGIGFCFATQVLPTIIFFSAFMTVLYHLGIMQKIVYAIAVVMQKTMKTSGAESLSAAANIFVGQTEAPLVIKPFVGKMTLSELNCIMVGGMATIAGGVMAAYVGMMKDRFPEIAGHLMAASVMSAPAALVFAKIMVPETEVPETSGGCELKVEKIDQNIIDAAARGASEGMSLAINVAAMLIAFIALIAMGNAAWQLVCRWIAAATALDLSAFDTLEELMGWVNAPLAWIMGIPTKDLLVAGQLLGEKTVLNEFVAYAHLGEIVNGTFLRDGVPVVIDDRTKVILTYACCGFANFGSIGIQLGGIGGLAPHRRGDLANLGIRALIAGTFASYQTANIAGLMVG
ncbi:MAG: Nucleoside permease NupC [Candidatus Ozemobacter sibiricus]|jgi:CNT family concentrative nucleoside transporter|uniref:Nucleoside permease NupC n=1 Tax=Candidatus Ozemobacter sibiricus TaxID=2268124 RepID=A0A367ZB63_9BACT|nr:MAG: Nucleoside permease NupC [Candidatus Ozemobacter sibiricus]